ncbi:MAG TPA: SRPBCC family protein [Actinomycetota bacterium]
MVTIHTHAETTVPADRVVAALTDFSDHRFELFANLDRRYFQLHDSGPTWAEVTEGSPFAGGIWERTRYDWSKPGTVRLDLVDSNAFAPGSSWEYRVHPETHGHTQVSLTVHRVPRTLKARLLATMLTIFGERVFRSDLAKTLQTIATRTTT